jgi:AraC-like DNA-binding protein/putative methionine-R-sulfoxide reductase with GAF domain
MNWNFFNSTILTAAALIVVVSIIKLLFFERNKLTNFLHWFAILANIVIIQVILIDIGIANKYPAIVLLYFPFQFLSPVFFTAFTFSYLNRMDVFKKFRFVLLVPFAAFFLLYTFFKINIGADYAFISKQAMAHIGYEWDENLAVTFSLILAIWNYRAIRAYEDRLGKLPYQIVIKKTKWLKGIYMAQVVLCIFWVCTIIYTKMDVGDHGNTPYYPLWFSFLLFYYYYYFLASKHLEEVENKKEIEKTTLKEVAHNFQISGLNKVFTSTELGAIQDSQYETTAILSYFATSLFDKNKTEDVLWDIVENCISKLNLEDCVIYILDNEKSTLIQKAAYGNKHEGEKKILSPLEISMGEGIVGAVAKNKKWELVKDAKEDPRYIEDDQKRQSELAVPILLEDTLFGVLDSEHTKKGFFNERHLFLFQLIAKLTATKLQQISKKTQNTITNDNAYYKDLCQLLEEEKMYRNSELSLMIVADKLNISSTYLSQLVNTLSDNNFSDFINLYRVRDAEHKLTNSDFSKYTILAIGLEAGFNSKSAFYNAFNKHTGITPSEYREKRPISS